MRVRSAGPADKEAIAAFTTDTFSWGDYVLERFDEWLADPAGRVLVAVDETDRPIALVNLVLVSPSEVWAQAARVHPDHRRKGLATELTRAGEAWASEQGALVVRLVTEGWNEPARRQVEKAGFRSVCGWAMTQRAVGNAAPMIEGNGGRRRTTEERLKPAHAAEAEPAFLTWSIGDLAAASHGLFPAVGWIWRQIHLEDVVRAAKERALWECPAGWLIGETTDELCRVGWVSTTPEDAYRLIRVAIDMSAEQGAELLRFLVPAVDWLMRAMRRAGLEVNPLVVYEKAV